MTKSKTAVKATAPKAEETPKPAVKQDATKPLATYKIRKKGGVVIGAGITDQVGLSPDMKVEVYMTSIKGQMLVKQIEKPVGTTVSKKSEDITVEKV